MQLVKSLSIISLLSIALAAPATVKEHEAQVEALGKEAGATPEEIKLIEEKIVSQNDGDDSGTDRGIIGMALDLLTGTTPEASPSPGGLVVHTGSGGQFHQAYPGTVPGYGYGGFGGFGGYGGYGGYGGGYGPFF
ncbi:hypothetical protein CONCODRAFT_73410 [Conidiobolus coronatus NRRL 28638]|uniref:Uncharacterized protein n=1 Tax=Conidiobolus coronatus (strain ATCC 28846 / CBS 209.66 / NRRL 28638) TaxID=796925 RepID=A0A137NVH2_CONC2|nr:hypothetical protein CONCODRAFT_73410 [Conidiobolus coronatus NRRL 28638]|eukprot:KXN66835.1 hypothetical protein CONCODRAFT_73410 [Conidiobolus coronatus NRRL 28638]